MEKRCPECNLINTDDQTYCDCGYAWDGGPKCQPEERTQSTAVNLGKCLVVAGLVGAAAGYFSGIAAPGSSTLNFGLALDRLVHVLGGLLVSVLGSGLMVYGEMSRNRRSIN